MVRDGQRGHLIRAVENSMACIPLLKLERGCIPHPYYYRSVVTCSTSMHWYHVSTSSPTLGRTEHPLNPNLHLMTKYLHLPIRRANAI